MNSSILKFLLLVAAAWAAACSDERSPDWAGSVGFVAVDVRTGDGVPVEPLPFSTDPVEIFLDIRVLSGTGDPVDFDGWLRVDAVPGSIVLAGGGNGVSGKYVLASDGAAHGVKAALAGAFGPTHILVEDDGFVPARPGVTPACSDGKDNDGDGQVDYPWDHGCMGMSDDSETGGTYAQGASSAIVFAAPTIAQVQGRDTKSRYSPLEGELVTLEGGFMLVTGVTREGMYVTDLADPGGYNHIYVYNFNTPSGVRVCDRLSVLSGSISEFFGFTEMNFPSWVLDPWQESKGPCPLPEPHVLTNDEIDSNTVMEGFESALVRVRDARVGDRVVDCDFNGDGFVDYRSYATNECSEECLCSEDCERDPLCTQATDYTQYGQWAVSVDGQKLLVVSRETVPRFDPFGPGHSTTISSLTGTLKNVSFLRPQWIIVPRCPDDVVVQGDPPPIDRTCIFPRTGEEDEPN